jgi:hypothetical protein
VRGLSFHGGGCLNLLRRLRAADDSVGAYSSALKNKGEGPRVSTCAKTKIRLFLPPSIWLKCRVSQGSTDKLHWTIHAWRLLDRAGFGRAHPCFSLTVWFQRERLKASLAVNTMEHISRSIVLTENVMAAEICGLAMVVRVLVAMRNCLSDL